MFEEATIDGIWTKIIVQDQSKFQFYYAGNMSFSPSEPINKPPQ